MKLGTVVIIAASALLVAAATLSARLLLGEEAAEPVTVAQGEVEVRIAGPGTVQARVHQPDRASLVGKDCHPGAPGVARRQGRTRRTALPPRKHRLHLPGA
jgi:hypothetical protein